MSTLPPLYPHCMRHQQHRCLYGNPYGSPPPLPLPRPGALTHSCGGIGGRPYLPQTCSDGHLEGLQRAQSLQRGRSLQRKAPMHPADGLLVLKVVSAACGEPDKRANYEIVSVSERHGRFRRAVPCMPLALSILLCIVNMLAPGLGRCMFVSFLYGLLYIIAGFNHLRAVYLYVNGPRAERPKS